jgi:O-succinylbenzoic acid--CoA ligase
VTRPLIVVDAGDPRAVHSALREALSGGPAVLPRQAGPNPDPSAPATVPRSVAVVVETSGSTGVPKRVALSADALLAGAAASAGAIGGTEPGTSQWLLAVPAHYVAGIIVLVRSIVAGTEPVILPPGHFDPAAYCAAAETMHAPVRLSSLVPAQLARLLDHAESLSFGDRDRVLAALRRFDTLLIGGQALHDDLHARAREAGLRIVRTYGSSETGGGCVYDGVPLGDVHARVVDGQIELGGSGLAEGYLAPDGTLDRDRTDAVFHTDDLGRWFRTGDLGTVIVSTVTSSHVFVDGERRRIVRVTVTGRADNVIVSGGEKVSLDLVQTCVRRLPGYRDAVVVPAPSAQWGQVPAVVRSSRGDAPSAAAPGGAESADLPMLRAAVRAELGRAAAPAHVFALDELPLLASGKPDRMALVRWVRAQLAQLSS